MIAAALHGYSQFVRPAESRDEKRHQHRQQGFGPVHKTAGLEVCAPGFLSGHYLVRLLDKSGDKAQGHAHHYGHLVYGQLQLFQRPQQYLQPVGKGDGAGGVLLEQTNTKHFLGQSLRTFGNKGDRLIAGHLGVTDDVLKNKRKLSAFTMNGQEVYRFATHEVPRSILKACSDAQIELDQIDHFLLHQANERIIAQVAKKLKQPLSKFAIDIDEYGNTAAASEAILLAEMMQKRQIKPGEVIALSGFGGGLTTATLIIKY